MSIPQLDVFSIPEFQTNVERDIITDHRPLSVLTSKNHIDFEIHLPQDEYLRFDKTYMYLKLKVKLTKTDGSEVSDEDWSEVIPCQYLLNTMFRQVNLQLGSIMVTPSTGNFMYKAYMEGLLGYTYDARTAHLSAAMWAEADDEVLRNKFIQKGSEFEMMGRLHLDMTHQEKALIGGTKVSIRLYTNPVDFMFKYGDDVKIDYEICDAYLEAHRMGITEAIRKQHRLKLENTPANYSFVRSEVKNLVLATGSSDVWLDNVFSGNLPRRIFFAMVHNDAYNGHREKDPFNFEHFDISFFAAYIEGRQYPPNGLTPDFSKGLCIREYMSLMRALNQNATDSICNIALKDYKENRIIFGVNFAPDLSNGFDLEGKRNTSKAGTLRIKLKFSKPLPHQVTALIYAEFDSDITIDVLGNATTNYM